MPAKATLTPYDVYIYTVREIHYSVARIKRIVLVQLCAAMVLSGNIFVIDEMKKSENNEIGEIKLDEKQIENMIHGYAPFCSPDRPRPLNKTVIEYVLSKRYGKGTSKRGRTEIIVGIVFASLFMLALTVPGIWTIIGWLICESFAGLLIWIGVRRMRNWKARESKIIDGDFYLKEVIVAEVEIITDAETLCDTHAVTFATGEMVHVDSIRNDRTFYENGKTGDKCYLLFFDSQFTGYVFDARWWALQPDLEAFTKNRQSK